jgi:hypothetical protein
MEDSSSPSRCDVDEVENLRPHRRLEILGKQIRGWLPKESGASGQQEAKPLSDTNTFVIRVLVVPILALGAWATLAFIYGGLFVQAILFLLYIGFTLILLLHRERSIKIAMRCKEA